MRMANIVEYDRMEQLTKILSKARMKAPPAGRERISFNQMAEAERAFWDEITELCGDDGVRPDPDATEENRPVMKHWQAALDSVNFRMALLHREARSTRTRSPPQKKGAANSSKEGKKLTQFENENRGLKRKLDQLAAAQNIADAFSDGSKKKDGKGKGKGRKGKGKKDSGRGSMSSPAMPRELIGMCSSYKGKNICFDWNMSGRCDKAEGGEECPKGLHVCCVPVDGVACGAPRSRFSHDEH